MKKKTLLLFISFIFSATSILGQEIPQLKVSNMDMTNVIFRYWGDNETVVQVQSTVPLEFESTMDKTINVPNSKKESGFFFYELLFPTDKKYSGRKLKIRSYGFDTYIQPLELQAKVPVGLRVWGNKEVAITVLGKDEKPLESAKIEIAGMQDAERTNDKGFREIKLPDENPAMLVITHRLYSDTAEIAVRPGNEKTVHFRKLKPVVQEESEQEKIKREAAEKRAKESDLKKEEAEKEARKAAAAIAEAQKKMNDLQNELNETRSVTITVKDIDGKPLANAVINLKGKQFLGSTDNNGIRKVVLPDDNSATLAVSHSRYFDIQEIKVSPRDKKEVQLRSIKCDNAPAVISTLADAQLEKKSKDDMMEYTENNGVYNITVPCGKTATIVFSHRDYFDKKEIKVRSGDRQKVSFTDSKYAEITVLDKNGKPLSDAEIKLCGTDKVYRDGMFWIEGVSSTTDLSRLSPNAQAEIKKLEPYMKDVWYTDNKGVCRIKLPTATNYRLDISHRSYYHDRELIARSGVKSTTQLRHIHDFKRFNFSILGGIGFPSQTSDSWIYADSSEFYVGGVAGMVFEFKLSRHISFQPELLYKSKGGDGVAYTSDKYINATTDAYIPDVKVNSTVRLHYIEIPLNLVVNIPYSDGNGAIFFGAGYYYSYGLFGKMTQLPSKAGYSFDPETEKNDVFGGDTPMFSRSDYGVNFMIGCNYNRYCFIRAGYDLGLKNIANGDGAYFKNRNFYIAVGFSLSKESISAVTR
jgi:protocatechuate 3,4-dioxygenase beta subunit